MTTRTTTALIVILVAAAFAVGIYVYPQLPSRLPTHWDMAGHVNQTADKSWVVVLHLPIVMSVILASYLASLLLPNAHVQLPAAGSLRHAVNTLFFAMIALLGAVYAMFLAWSLGLEIDFRRFALIFVAAVVWCVGLVAGALAHRPMLEQPTDFGSETMTGATYPNVFGWQARLLKILAGIACIGAMPGLLNATQAVYLLVAVVAAIPIIVIGTLAKGMVFRDRCRQ